MYTTTFYITEPDINGKFRGESHDYVIETETPITFKQTQDIIFLACEIERIYSGEIYIEKQVEKDGEYFDSDEWICVVDIKFTKDLTPYIDWKRCKAYPIYSIDRKNSCIRVID